MRSYFANYFIFIVIVASGQSCTDDMNKCSSTDHCCFLKNGHVHARLMWLYLRFFSLALIPGKPLRLLKYLLPATIISSLIVTSQKFIAPSSFSGVFMSMCKV